MRPSVYHLVILLRDGRVDEEGNASGIHLELDPGEGYGGYTYEELIALHRKRIGVPKPGICE